LYPRALVFDKKLLQSVINKHKDRLDKESFALKLLKALIFKSKNFDVSKIYEDERILRIVEELSPFINRALQAKTTKELFPVARELCSLLYGKTLKEKFPSKTPSNLQNQRQELNNKIEQARQELSEKIVKDLELREQDKSLRRRCSIYETKKYNATDEREKNKNAKKAQELEEQKEKNREELRSNYEKAIEQKKAIESDEQTERELAEKLVEELGENLFSEKSVSLSGFDALSKEPQEKRDLSQKKSRELLKVSDSELSELAEIIKETIIRKQERLEDDETGDELNGKRLDRIYTDVDSVFETYHKKEYNTKIAFVVDGSGSMNNADKDKIALGAVRILLDAVQRAIDDGAPVSFDVYVFGLNLAKLTNDELYYRDRDRLEELFYRARNLANSQNTRIACNVNKVAELLKSNSLGDRVAIVITDAEVNPRDLKDLHNTAKTDGANFVFVGIKAKQSLESLELFGKDNIKKDDEALSILRQALLRSLQ
jgi:chemotaxis protein histidine kinase CheA